MRLEAVVLRHINWGEADRLLWLFSREMGKVRAVAKGVRKPRSRKAGHVEPFTRVSLQLARGRDMLLVTQAEAMDAYLPLHEDLLRMGYASYVVELLDRFTYEEGENRPLYRLLTDTLERIGKEAGPAPGPGQTVASPEAASQGSRLALAVRYYEIRLLDLLGFRPQLFECAVCGNEILAEDQYFSAALGGVLCPNCGLNAPGARPISQNALRHLRHFQRSSYTEATRAHLTSELDRELEQIMQHYLTYLLERGLNTPEFLRRVKLG